MGKIFGVEFVPLSVPLPKRIQILAVSHYIFIFIVSPMLLILFGIYAIFKPSYWWILFLYGIWFYYDRNTPKTGGRPWLWYRKLSLWNYFRDYFPVSLEKTEDLDPERNYIFGYHPHGVLGVGMFTNFGSEATGFSKKFPGIIPHPITLVCQFYFPLRREYAMTIGE